MTVCSAALSLSGSILMDDEQLQLEIRGIVGELAQKMNRPMSWPVKVLKGYVRKELDDLGYPMGQTSAIKVMMNKKARTIVIRWSSVLLQEDKQKQTDMAVEWIKEYLDEEERESDE